MFFLLYCADKYSRRESKRQIQDKERHNTRQIIWYRWRVELNKANDRRQESVNQRPKKRKHCYY